MWKGAPFGKASVVRRFPSLDVHHSANPTQLLLAAFSVFVEHIQNHETTKSEDEILAPLVFIVVLAGNNSGHLDIIKEMLGLINTRVGAQQLYINFIALMINSSSQLDVLSQVEGDHLSQIEGLPSWVPDYSVPLSDNLLHRSSFNATVFLFKMASKDNQDEEAPFGLAPIL
jgi:hypothetical protein